MRIIKPLFLFLIASIIYGCSDDDMPNVDSQPEFTFLEQSVSSLPGETFELNGEFSDSAGIKSINIKYEPWYLDKTIDLESLPKSYELSYLFKVPNDAVENSQHTITITIVNSGNVAVSYDVVVTLDDDITPPQIEIISPFDGATVVLGDGDDIHFNINLTDKALGEFKVESDVFSDTVTFTGSSANYSNSLNIDAAGLYEFTFTATDENGNVTVTTSLVNVVSELSFLKMYLADVSTSQALSDDLTGVPYPFTNSTVAGEEGVVFSIKYYTDQANKEVRFIPQKSLFEPYVFGQDPNSGGNLLLGTDATVNPIVLGDAGYYDITVDLRDLTYTATKYTPPAATPYGGDFVGVYMAGTGLIVGGNELSGWSPATALAFNVDPNNAHRYSQTVTFIDGVQGQFIFVGNTSNWNKFWRLNMSSMKAAEFIVPQGGENCYTDVSDSAYTGTFLVTIDLHLLTFEVTRI